ncbi:hypothetical protein ACU686_25860 [Yinghuangia aomiensis]
MWLKRTSQEKRPTGQKKLEARRVKYLGIAGHAIDVEQERSSPGCRRILASFRQEETKLRALGRPSWTSNSPDARTGCAGSSRTSPPACWRSARARLPLVGTHQARIGVRGRRAAEARIPRLRGNPRIFCEVRSPVAGR